MTIKNIPANERPRERCLKEGPNCLSLRELLAVLIGSGTQEKSCIDLATEILDRLGTGLSDSDLERAFFLAFNGTSFLPFSEIRGIGKATLTRILTALEIGRRYQHFLEKQSLPVEEIIHPLDKRIYMKVPQSFRSAKSEWIGFIPIYFQNKMGNFCLVEKGNRTHVNTDPVELFSRILSLRPVAFTLLHNHPSGNMTPSHDDFELTENVEKLARDLGIPLLGHWIVTATGVKKIKRP